MVARRGAGYLHQVAKADRTCPLDIRSSYKTSPDALEIGLPFFLILSTTHTITADHFQVPAHGSQCTG